MNISLSRRCTSWPPARRPARRAWAEVRRGRLRDYPLSVRRNRQRIFVPHVKACHAERGQLPKQDSGPLGEQAPFSGLPSFLRKPSTRDMSQSDLVVLGVPFDGGCTNRVGARHSPRAVREQSLYIGSFQPVYPWDYDLSSRYRIMVFGDVAPLPGTRAIEFMMEATQAVAAEVFAAGRWSKAPPSGPAFTRPRPARPAGPADCRSSGRRASRE